MWQSAFVVLLAIFLLVQGVSAVDPPNASFSVNATNGTVPFTVQFTDSTTNSPASWSWFFGDETYTNGWYNITGSSGWGPARRFASAVTTKNGSILLLGGYNSVSYFNDTWLSVDNAQTWTKINASSGWPVGMSYGMVVTSNDTIVIMGGTNGAEGRMNQTWHSVDGGKTWSQINASSGWTGRTGASFVILPDDSIVLTGGYDTSSSPHQNDVWKSIDYGYTWARVNSSPGWAGRYAHSSVVMHDGSIVLMGGSSSSGAKNDVWRSTNGGSTWIEVNSSAGWSARTGSSVVAMPDDSIVLMAGSTGTYQTDVWRSIDSGKTWSCVNTSAGWTGRYGPMSVVDNNGSIIFMGGQQSGGNSNTTFALYPAGSTLQNPVHTYTASSQIHNVSLLTANSAGYNITTVSNIISTFDKPIVSFTANNISNTIPVGVQFNDTTTGSETQFNWSLGDGNFATTRNITYSYAVPGTYMVNLTVWNSASTNTTGTIVTTATYPSNLNYYFYGDSITRGISTIMGDGNLNLYGADSYGLQMAARYNSSAIVGHNIDGNGKNSNWSVENIGSHVGPNATATVEFVMFGANDLPYGITGLKTAQNLKRISDYLKANGTKAVILISPIPVNGSHGTETFDDWVDNITIEQNYLSANNVSFMKTYDAIDSVPGNGIVDPANATLLYDGLHPTKEGHSIIANYIWNSSLSVNFTANTTFGQNPLNIRFNDTTISTIDIITDITGWNWSFGDGTYSELQNPTHTYTTPGNYSVSEMVTGAFGSNTLTKTDYIYAYSLIPSFSANPTSGNTPLFVNFVNTSTTANSAITGINWSFGDGMYSSQSNPQHQFATTDSFPVILNITNGFGFNTTTLTITAGTTVTPSVDYWANTVTTLGQPTGFVDSSTNNPTSWYWMFGDGSISTTQNPSHTYALAGYYTVNHSATNAYGTTWTNRTNYVAVSPTTPTIITSFTGTPTSGLASLAVAFTDTSIALPYPATSWLWNFGDTGTSTLQNPSHTYNTPGTYSVSLTTANANLTNSTTYTNYITVTAPIPSSAFVKSITSDATTTSININRYEYDPLSLFNPDTLVPITTAQTITYLGDSTTMDTMAKLPAIAFYGDDGSYWIYRTV